MNYHILAKTLFWRGVFFFTLLSLILAACGPSTTPSAEVEVSLVTPNPAQPVGTQVAAGTPEPAVTGIAEAPANTEAPVEASEPLEAGTAQAPGEAPMPTQEPEPQGQSPSISDPSLGTVIGRVTYRDNSGQDQPDVNAIVEMVSNVGNHYLSTVTDQDGKFTFANVPPDVQFWIVASSSIGSSNNQEVKVGAGQTATLDLVTRVGFPIIKIVPAGGHILVDGQRVAGATVWQLSRNESIITNENGYFGFYYVPGTPIIAVFGNRWEVTTLEPNAVKDIELTRSGPHPVPPDGPVLTSIQVGVGSVVTLAVTPPVFQAPTSLVGEIAPTAPALATRQLLPTRSVVEVVTAVPILPTLALIPTSPAPVAGDNSIPTECGQSDASANYGPIRVGSAVILGRHTPVDGVDNWSGVMEKYVNQKTTVIKLAGVDKVGCPGVRVDIDAGESFWRIRDLTLLEP